MCWKIRIAAVIAVARRGQQRSLASTFQPEHADALGRLVARRLTGAAVVRFVEDDSWYAECPVVLGFEGEQVEICHQKFDDLSITFNTIDCDAPTIGWEESGFSRYGVQR